MKNFNYKNLFAVCPLASSPKVGDIFDFSTCLISRGIFPILFASALAVFTWGAVQYALNAQDEKKREEGKKFIVWGLIAFTVMISVLGLITIITNSFSIGHANPTIQSVSQ